MYIYSAEMFFEGRVKSGASVNCSEVIGKGVPERNCWIHGWAISLWNSLPNNFRTRGFETRHISTTTGNKWISPILCGKWSAIIYSQETIYGQLRNFTQSTCSTQHICFQVISSYDILEPQSGIKTIEWALYLALWSIFSSTSESIKVRKKKHYPPMPTVRNYTDICKKKKMKTRQFFWTLLPPPKRTCMFYIQDQYFPEMRSIHMCAIHIVLCVHSLQ